VANRPASARQVFCQFFFDIWCGHESPLRHGYILLFFPGSAEPSVLLSTVLGESRISSGGDITGPDWYFSAELWHFYANKMALCVLMRGLNLEQNITQTQAIPVILEDDLSLEVIMLEQNSPGVTTQGSIAKYIRNMRRSAICLSIVGVLATMSGAVWITTILPRYEKIPSDFHMVEEYEGSFSVVDPIVEKIRTNAAIQRIVNDRDTLQLLLDPQTQAVLAQVSKSLQQPATGPQDQAILSQPGVQGLMSNPAVHQLLSDPSALELLADPRAAQLMADPASLPVVQVPVRVRKDWSATNSSSDRVFVSQQATIVRADTGQELEGFPSTTTALVVDRVSKVYLEGSEGGRIGGLSFPFDVQKDVVYPLWVDAANQPLDARYVSTEQVDQLEVFVFKITEYGNRSLGIHPDLGLPLVLDADITIRVEPRTGRVIDVEEHATAISLEHPQRGRMPLFVSDIEYTQETVDTQIAAAKADRAKLEWFGRNLPWGAMISGLLLALSGIALLLIARSKVSQRATKEEVRESALPRLDSVEASS